MKRIVTTTSILLMGFAQHAIADNYLFPTDVLDVGRFDIHAGIAKSTSSDSMQILPSNGFDARAKNQYRHVSEYVSIRYGFAEKWHVGVTLPYSSVYSREVTNTPGHANRFRNSTIQYDKNQNMQVWVKRKLVSEEGNPFSLSAELNLSANTANQSKTALMGGLVAGWRFGDSLSSYVGYQMFVPDHDGMSTENTVYAGIEKKINDKFTLIPHVSYSRVSSSEFYSATSNYALGIAARIEVASNSYLSPSYSYYHVDEFSEMKIIDHSAVNDGQILSLSFYHLF